MNENLTHFLERDNSQWVYNGDFSIDYNWNHQNGLWTETNEETYWDQLGCVPPRKQSQCAFMVGEPYSDVKVDGKWHIIYATFIEVDDRYFGKFDIVKNYNPAKYSNEIRKQFAMDIV